MSKVLKAVLTATSFPADTVSGPLRFATYQSPMATGDQPVDTQDAAAGADSVTVTLPPGKYVTVAQRLDGAGKALGQAESPEWEETATDPGTVQPSTPATIMVDIPSAVTVA